MTHRNILVGALLGIVVATQAQALVKKVPIYPGSNVLVPYTPPYIPPQPPAEPAAPYIGLRTPYAISFGWWVLDASVTSSGLERSTGLGDWTVIASYGVLSGPQQYTDGGPPLIAPVAVQAMQAASAATPAKAGKTKAAKTTKRKTRALATGLTSAVFVANGVSLTPDKRYCYRVRTTNSIGTTYSDVQCTYTKELVIDAEGKQVTRSVSRLQIRIKTGGAANADTDDSVAVLLNSATSLYAVPSGNKTWLDYPKDDFKRSATDLYDLNTSGLSDIGDISMVSIQKFGGDDWCLAGFDLIVNNQSNDGAPLPGTVLVSKSFSNQPGGCVWLTDASPNTNMFTVHFAELRATAGWYAVNPTILPVVPKQQIESQIASKLGHAFHDSEAYWGPNGHVTVSVPGDGHTLHVDTRFEVSVEDASNPDVYVSFDLLVSGGCQGDGTLTLAIEPANMHVDADLGVLAALGGFFECIGTLSGGPTCIQDGVEDAVREAFQLPSAGFTSHGISICNGTNREWTVLNGGNIVLDVF